MILDTEYLKETFAYGYDAYYTSRKKHALVHNMFNNRQYTEEELCTLSNRGQPAETFNVIRLFTRQLLGYYSTTINRIITSPTQTNDIILSSMLNDMTESIYTLNNFDTEGDKIKLDCFLSGLMVSYTEVVPKRDYEGNIVTDNYGRNINIIKKHHVPSEQVVIDPSSTLADYSDARFIHRFKWLSKEDIEISFPKTKSDNLNIDSNFLNIEEADKAYTSMGEAISLGNYSYFGEYLVVHSIVKYKGDTYSIYWSHDTILSKEKVTFREIPNPYTVVKLQDSNKVEYYGIFEDIIESQRAINQALIQIQLLSNSNKVFIQEGAVEDLAKFTEAYSRVNSVIPVLNLNGIRVEASNAEIQQQYIIIDKAFNRIQRVLGINDSFLGMAYASDSGRKVKLQQNATIMALRYINNKLELFYLLDGRLTISLIKQFYTANQILRVVDEQVGERWLEFNKPLVNPHTGKVIYDEVLDDRGVPLSDAFGNIILAPINDSDTDVKFSEVDVTLEVVSYNDEDEKSQLLLETMISGNIGQSLLSANPAGFFKVASLSVKSIKSKHSLDIAKILIDTANNLGGAGTGEEAVPTGQSPKSSQLKLPQNTNEE